VLEQAIHALAILQSAGGWPAAATGVLKEVNVRLKSILAILAAWCWSSYSLHVDCRERMSLVMCETRIALGPEPRSDGLVTILAKIEVRAFVTVVSYSMGDI
jgi:hypothetical protein